MNTITTTAPVTIQAMENLLTLDEINAQIEALKQQKIQVKRITLDNLVSKFLEGNEERFENLVNNFIDNNKNFFKEESVEQNEVMQHYKEVAQAIRNADFGCNTDKVFSVFSTLFKFNSVEDFKALAPNSYITRRRYSFDKFKDSIIVKVNNNIGRIAPGSIIMIYDSDNYVNNNCDFLCISGYWRDQEKNISPASEEEIRQFIRSLVYGYVNQCYFTQWDAAVWEAEDVDMFFDFEELTSDCFCQIVDEDE